MSARTVLGLDIGFGFVKATNWERVAVFPSVAGDAVQADYDNDLIKGRGVTITLDGRDWFYGAHAQKQSRNTLALFARERTEQVDLMRLLFCAALVELGVSDGTAALCTGLPVDWFNDRDALEGLLRGPHTFQVDGVTRTVVVSDVATVPQPFGSFFDTILDGGGQLINADYARAKVGILDVGTFTSDLALSEGLEYIAKASGSKTVAMATVWRQVRDGIKARYGLDYELHQIDHIMRNGQTVMVQGRDRDISDLVQAAIDALAQQVLAFARDRWGNARDFRRIILTGGGAYYLAGAVRAVYPHTLVVDAPHVGNLRGFFKYAVRKYGR